MPIYAYRCAECAHTEDTLQKMSDAPLTHCPQCKQATFKKQLTAAAFQFKGSGYYVTDFRDAGTASTSSASHASVKTESNKQEASTSQAHSSGKAAAVSPSSASSDSPAASVAQTVTDTASTSSATLSAGS